MTRRIIGISFTLLAVFSSLATALARRHVEFSVSLAGTSGSGMRGTGLITPSAKTTEAKNTVALRIDKDVANAERPWGIHHGTCAKRGALLGGARNYPPITMSAGGSATVKVVLPILFPDTGVFYLSMHESARNMSKVVACGDLMLED